VPAARAEIGDAEPRHASQSLDLAPQFGFGPRIENVEPEFAQRLELRTSF